MLLRTKLQCKFRTAVFIRMILFFGIPSLYLIHFHVKELMNSDYASSGISSDMVKDDLKRAPLRKLMHIVERDGKNCTSPAILEFPSDMLTRVQRQQGFIVIHCILAVYCFLLLGTICEQYFVPAIEIICERLHMASDVAGATFMAAASSSPELFINCVGTFVTEGDLGVGAVVGSAVFNVLAVPACCAIFASRVVELDWWSVSRDCLMYAVAVVALVLALLDDKIYWHEALLLVLMYTLYIMAMVFNGQIGSFFKSGFCIKRKPKLYSEITPLLLKNDISKHKYLSNGNQIENTLLKDDVEQPIELTKLSRSSELEQCSSSVWSWPNEDASVWKKFYWMVTWPIGVVLWATVPNCRRKPRLYPATFLMCISWIGGVSYVVAWIITIVGDTLDVPDSITGLTILAAGTSLPEAVSSVLVTNHGHGSMGISNSIGSNTFDILLCLGLPWLIKSLFLPSVPGNHWVKINSSGLSYSAISLLSTLFTLYGSLAINKFQLDWKIGVTCILVYIGFLILATLIELNVLFMVNLPMCPH